MTTPRLVLGSASPRRVELLRSIGIEPDEIRPPDIDEAVHPRELPASYVARIAREKAAAVSRAGGEVVLCADTTVAVGRRILGKAGDRDEARAFLDLMSGRRHKVLTAVAVVSDRGTTERLVTTTVKFKRLSPVERDAYLASDDWQGKAGAYAIQGPAAVFVTWLQGSHSAVVGLPLAETAALLAAAGYPVWRPA